MYSIYHSMNFEFAIPHASSYLYIALNGTLKRKEKNTAGFLQKKVCETKEDK